MKNNKTYHIITIGCQMNKVDSERLAAFLESGGYQASPDFKRADVVIINTCGIRQTAEDRVYGLVDQVRKFNPSAKVVIAGCLSKRADVKKRLAGRADVFLPISEMPRLPELLGGEEFKSHFSLDEVRLEQGEKYLDIKPKHESKTTAYIPIGNGCNNFCSYCVVPYARGQEVYRDADSILKEVCGLLKNGYKEIILIAQNVNSYHDAKIKFPALLEKVIKIPGKFWIRFSSSHPKDMSADLIRVIGLSPKVCPHLHLAVQSGDDKILKAMNRGYTAKYYQDLIKRVRAVRPGIAITTDVIVGFPGETKAQFLNTVKLFKVVNFDLAYIAKYSPRPGTVSYKMKDNVSTSEKKRRASGINEILKITAAKNNQSHLGEIMEVLVEGQNRRGKYYGKTGSYQTVLINADVKGDSKDGPAEGFQNGLIGNFVKVKINKALAFGLEGNLVVESLKNKSSKGKNKRG
ncbi:MAG: tRNA (N6-isopentenyl adenosine(37)-C2)-methylthiotransferase MiaB [Candidatus Falkowbacteria bacterium]|nr:tRNA (N6-isopentenyl adenosine(37)-C2)-methylthiotransferase MiaB [Candidatus Falkowbacteria bacterium]